MDVVYCDPSIESFIAALEARTYAKTLQTIGLLRFYGNMLMMPHARHLGEGLHELRIRGKQEVRLLYTFHKNHAVIVYGLVKKTQKIPPTALRIAKERIKTLTSV